MTNSRRQKVFVAMSGGVDSSVAAYLLQSQGYDVAGISLKLHQGSADAQQQACGGDDSLAAAKEVAHQLGIPHSVLDCQTEFRDFILKPSWQEYQRGRTPNPCVWCNQKIKFGELLRHAMAAGADFLATGHHAQLNSSSAESRQAENAPLLLRGKDPGKDQSYFLFALSNEQRCRTLFPVGNYTKDQVRAMARQAGLSTAERPESQDACFGQAEESFAEALRHTFHDEAQPGEFVDEKGQVLGHHHGIHRYTIGQRRGLGIALGQRAYVIGICAEKHQVVIGQDPQALEASGLVADQVQWHISPETWPTNDAEVQIRYRHAAVPVKVEFIPQLNEVKAYFLQPQRAVTPGQAAVFYNQNRVLGGGWIRSALTC